MTRYAYLRGTAAERHHQSNCLYDSDLLSEAWRDRDQTFDESIRDTSTIETPLESRKAVRSLLARVGAGDTVFLASLSDVSNDPLQASVFAGMITSSGASLQPVDGAPEAEVSMTMSGMVALMETHRRVSEAVSKARRVIDNDRVFQGGRVPYGKRLENGFLMVDDHEQEGIAHAISLRSKGMSLHKICRRLEELGYRPKSGGQWYATGVRRLINSHSDKP
jgi:hypothetical protein